MGLENNDEEKIVQQQKLAERISKDLETRWLSKCERRDIDYKSEVKMEI